MYEKTYLSLSLLNRPFEWINFFSTSSVPILPFSGTIREYRRGIACVQRFRDRWPSTVRRFNLWDDQPAGEDALGEESTPNVWRLTSDDYVRSYETSPRDAPRRAARISRPRGWDGLSLTAERRKSECRECSAHRPLVVAVSYWLVMPNASGLRRTCARRPRLSGHQWRLGTFWALFLTPIRFRLTLTSISHRCGLTLISGSIHFFDLLYKLGLEKKKRKVS